jgi:hypothetical protein
LDWRQKKAGYFCKKMIQVSHHPTGENSANLVTLALCPNLTSNPDFLSSRRTFCLRLTTLETPASLLASGFDVGTLMLTRWNSMFS